MLRTLVAVVVLALLGGNAFAQSRITVYPDTPGNRAAIAFLGGSGQSLAAASSGDTTLVNLAGNGFERGMLHSGTTYSFSGAALATEAQAAHLDTLIRNQGITVPVIIVVEVPKLPDWCIYAICLPSDWAALGGDSSTVGNGLKLPTFAAMGGSWTVGNGRVLDGQDRGG